MDPEQYSKMEISSRHHMEGQPILVLEVGQRKSARKYSSISVMVVDIRVAEKEIIDSCKSSKNPPYCQ